MGHSGRNADLEKGIEAKVHHSAKVAKFTSNDLGMAHKLRGRVKAKLRV